MSNYGQYDLRGLLGNQTGEDLIEKTKVTKVFLIGLDEIRFSKENIYQIDPDDAELLAKNIQENGIIHDLVGYRDEEGYTLISGHRRLTALKLLCEQGQMYTYHGMDITGKAPLTIVDRPDNSSKVGLQIVSGNHQRSLSADEKKEVIRYTVNCLKALEAEGLYEWPKGVRACDVLAEKTGISAHFIKDYLARTGISKTEGVPDPEMEEKHRQSKQVSEEEKAIKGLRKAMKTLNKRVAAFDWSILLELDEQQTDEIRKELQDLLSRLQVHAG